MTPMRLLGAAGAGAALMFLLDPDRGRRRRALIRDRMVRVAHLTGDAVDATSRDMTNRARGVVADLRGRLAGAADVSDGVLGARVRSRLGAVVGYASAIRADVASGRVTLSGPVLADDVARLVRRVEAVRGVKQVDSRLDVHAEPGDVAALQGARRIPRGGEVFELMQNNWSPSARVVTGVAGTVLTLWGLRRFDPLGVAAALAGFGLLSRAAANMPLTRLTGGSDGPGARLGHLSGR